MHLDWLVCLFGTTNHMYVANQVVLLAMRMTVMTVTSLDLWLNTMYYRIPSGFTVARLSFISFVKVKHIITCILSQSCPLLKTRSTSVVRAQLQRRWDRCHVKTLNLWPSFHASDQQGAMNWRLWWTLKFPCSTAYSGNIWWHWDNLSQPYSMIMPSGCSTLTQKE